MNASWQGNLRKQKRRKDFAEHCGRGKMKKKERNRRIIAGVIAAILVAAMIIPMILQYLI